MLSLTKQSASFSLKEYRINSSNQEAVVWSALKEILEKWKVLLQQNLLELQMPENFKILDWKQLDFLLIQHCHQIHLHSWSTKSGEVLRSSM